MQYEIKEQPIASDAKMDAAKAELARFKSYRPFRAWFAADINGEWQFFDSKRKLTNTLRKEGIQQTTMLSAQ